MSMKTQAEIHNEMIQEGDILNNTCHDDKETFSALVVLQK